VGKTGEFFFADELTDRSFYFKVGLAPGGQRPPAAGDRPSFSKQVLF
jgi:hypothetical protein